MRTRRTIETRLVLSPGGCCVFWGERDREAWLRGEEGTHRHSACECTRCYRVPSVCRVFDAVLVSRAISIMPAFGEWDLKKILRVATGLPLLLGIVGIAVFNAILVQNNAPAWMNPVSKALEEEEISSLSRLTTAQAGFAEEVMSQMFEEVELVQSVMSAIVNGEVNTTAGILPENGRFYTLPMGPTANVLNYNQYTVPTTPTTRTCTKAPFPTTECWSDPEYPLTTGRVKESASVSSSDKGSVSLKATGVYWPHPKATGSEGPTNECDDVNIACSTSYKFTDTNDLDAGLKGDIDMTSYISDMFRETFEANAAIEFMYIGTHAHGVFRSYPYGHAVGRVTKPRKSARDGKTRIGYDPRHRPWYYQCEQAKKTIVTPPYVDATTDELVITVATPIYNTRTGSLVAIIGYDVSIAALETLVSSSKVLENGYAFLVAGEQGYTYSAMNAIEDDTGKLVVFPRMTAADIDAGKTQINDWEFRTSSQSESATFAENVFSDMKAMNVGTATYKKNKKLWHIAYAPVPTAKYSLAFVVPDADILLPSTRVQTLIQQIAAEQGIVFLCIVLVGLAVFIWMQVELAHFVVQPIVMLRRVIELIIKDLNREHAIVEKTTQRGTKPQKRFALHVNDLIEPKDEGCVEIKMMKESFEHMLMALRFGDNSMATNDLDNAYQIYDEARVMFLALHNERGSGIATFNLAVVCHKRWLQSERHDVAAFRAAEDYYLQSIANGRTMWSVALGRPDHEGVTLDINGEDTGIQMVQRVPSAPRAVSAVALVDNHYAGEDIPQRLVGNDIADKLAARLHHYARLLTETGMPDHLQKAQAYVIEALNLDKETLNILGYSSRVGLYGEILVSQGRVTEAEQQVMGQLDVLRKRVQDLYRSEDREYYSGGLLQRSKSESHEVMELFQSFQNGLIDAGNMLAMVGEETKDLHALMLYREALSCSERSKEYTIRTILLKIKEITARLPARTVSQTFLKSLDNELARKGLSGGGPKQLAFVIDYSGSMAGGKIRRARNGVEQVLSRQMNAGDMAGIVKFSSTPEVVMGLSRDMEKVSRAVKDLSRPGGPTALWDALGMAIETVLESDVNLDPWIVCVSDGADNRSKAWTPERLAAAIQREGINIIILSVGVTEASAVTNMHLVAKSGKRVGEMIEVASSEDIDAAFNQIENLVGGGLEVQRY